MKKLTLLSIVLCTALLVCACSGAPQETTATTAPASQPTETEPATTAGQPVAEYEAPLTSVALPAITEESYTDDGKLLSYYTYQNVSVMLPDADIAEVITLDLLNRIDTTTAAGEAVHTTAAAAYNGDANWSPYFYVVSYTPTRMDQNALSFYGVEASFDGSPRSMQANLSVNYDLTTGHALSLKAIMHEEYSADALCELIIEALTVYDEESLFFDYADLIRERFSTNVPVESWYFSSKGLCFFFAPYEIAPNSMGTVVAEIPYEKLSGLMKDQFFPAEKLNYVGTVQVQPLGSDLTILDNYSQFAELELVKGKDQLLLSVDGSVSNLQVFSIAQEDLSIMTDRLLFAAAGMGSTDALIMELDAELSQVFLITYESDGATQELLISLPNS